MSDKAKILKLKKLILNHYDHYTLGLDDKYYLYYQADAQKHKDLDLDMNNGSMKLKHQLYWIEAIHQSL